MNQDTKQVTIAFPYLTLTGELTFEEYADGSPALVMLSDDCGCRASDATERPESIAPRHPGATQSPDGSQGAGACLMTTTLVDDLRTARSRGVRPEAPDADLCDAYLRGADLRDAYLRGADLRGANLRGADLRDAYLRGADLCGANLRDAYLRGAYLRGADLRDADLRGADLCGADLCGADWRGLHIDGLPSGQVTLTPTPEGWDLTIGCWQHKTLADLAALIAGEITPPEARGPEIERRRPSWVAVLALCEAHAGMHPDVIEALAAKWGQAS